ncbi:23S rRNA (adenine(2030)-N(6))-methyltransferase RlmJ [Labrenzia sp. CE80]|uniref:23S rRNA (adenine(2030)-N(6))-methyltransferase RlmJ n=1 Tax=Labrenzia sp. CE80 TaxID=1788986 RepID=UPI00129AC79C|nr:23S rRNA (adenine(2030)-N(6))-methyltransferase RlmJ [Labrenzia sp. CE80]
MNYRHAYHAGNIGDVLKHAVLARLIVYLQRKDKAFRIIDTHAGIGAYDLTSEETQKTGEWLDGIAKVISKPMPDDVATLLAPWLDVVRADNPGKDLKLYPGSPALARELMRPVDRLTLTELHPADFDTLSKRFAGDHQVKTIHLDGWLALGSFLPPKEKRGLIIIDPAFEEIDEFDRMASAVIKGWRKFSTGTYACWYPLKDRHGLRRFDDALKDAGVKDVLTLELNVGKSGPDTAMLGSGMTIINPPYTLAEEMRTVLPWLRDCLRKGSEASWSVDQLIAE